ncbi:MAG: hypothetical protein ACI8UO_003466 [Verrucomicrobiales bacterium]
MRWQLLGRFGAAEGYRVMSGPVVVASSRQLTTQQISWRLEATTTFLKNPLKNRGDDALFFFGDLDHPGSFALLLDVFGERHPLGEIHQQKENEHARVENHPADDAFANWSLEEHEQELRRILINASGILDFSQF